ncbi:MAG: DUF1592 domain-containing protein [Planctomycetaceae bacterium]|nr:DUF1592 domain-containing protein [Planctomycetaceae bacterium]
MPRALLTLTAVWLSIAVSSVCPADDGDIMEVFLKRHCLRCHGPQTVERDLRVDTLSRDFSSGADGHLWAEILERINAGEMPPADERQPTEDEIAGIVAALNGKIRQGRAARLAARPAVAHYRLSRQEYQNTVYDLLGVRYDADRPGELNADPLWQGYERIGSQLSLSPSHVQRYYQAAETVVSRAFPVQPVETRSIRRSAAEIRYGGGRQQQQYLERFDIQRPLRALIFPGRLQPALRSNWFGQLGPQHSGLYRARMQVSGLRPVSGQTPHLRIGPRLAEASNEGLVEVDVLATEDEPQVVEFDVFLEMPVNLDFNVVVSDIISREKGGHHRNILGGPSYIFTHTSETRLLNPTGPQLFDDQGRGLFSCVILDWIEWEGPLETDAERATRDALLPPATATDDDVADRLQTLARRAWRRPVGRGELQPYLNAYSQERRLGEDVRSAWQVAVLGLLTSRHFTYLVEGDTEPRDRLNDYELASRLSYFLWSSLPDERLFQAAAQGQLTGGQLTAHVTRMLSDPKADRFVTDFPRQWLQLHRLGMFPPDEKLYPDYDVWLETSLREEVVAYFRQMFAGNLPVRQFLASDWTMANPRLCEFYGLPTPERSGFQRVALQPKHHRGGLLTMGAVLGLTSDGTRHRPVHRGVWVSEAIFGRTPPPPPANVDAIEPNPVDEPKATIRRKLQAHAQQASCAACHRSIDPLGLAFDEYDAVGQWRTHERVENGIGRDPAVDASGQLSDGRRFANAEQFKQRLLEDEEEFLQALVEHLCTYGLRRVLTVDDREDVRLIVDRARESGGGLRDVVLAVATSELFQKR